MTCCVFFFYTFHVLKKKKKHSNEIQSCWWKLDYNTVLHGKDQMIVYYGFMTSSSKYIWEKGNEIILQNKIYALTMTYTEHWAYRKSSGPDK